MITYQNRKAWQQPWVWALILGGAAGVAGWWWFSPAGQSNEPAPAAGVAAKASPWLVQTSAASAPFESALITPPPVLDGGRPADFSPEEWAALKDAMAKTPNPKAETERVVQYLRFQRGFEQWQNLKDTPDVAQRQELARKLIEQVPDRLRQGEMSMGEAIMVESALWADLEPNEAMRKQRIEEAKAVLAAAAPKPDPAQAAKDASLLAEYKRREAAIVADWQAKPVAQRDQAKLEEALESARRAVYAGNKN